MINFGNAGSGLLTISGSNTGTANTGTANSGTQLVSSSVSYGGSLVFSGGITDGTNCGKVALLLSNPNAVGERHLPPQRLHRHAAVDPRRRADQGHRRVERHHRPDHDRPQPVVPRRQHRFRRRQAN